MQQNTQYGIIAGAVILLGVVGWSMAGAGAPAGSLELLISDQQGDIADFSYLNVSFDEARVFRTTANNTTAYQTIDLTSTRTVDLTRVTGAKARSLINTSLETGTYQKMELMVSSVEASVNGSDVTVKVPSEKLQLTKPFTITANETTSFVFDIMVVLRGNQRVNQGYILRPVISQSGTAGEDVEVERAGPPSDGGPPADAGPGNGTAPAAGGQ